MSGVSAFQVHISDHDILTPGDSPDALGGHEPRCAAGQHRPDGAGHRLDRQSRRLRRAQPGQGRNESDPLTDGSLKAYTGLRGTHDLHHPAGLQGGRGQAPRTPSAPRTSSLWAWSAGSTRGRSSPPCSGSPSASLVATGSGSQHARLPGRLRLRRDGRALRVQLRGPPRFLREGRVRPGHGQPGAGVGSDRRRPSGRPPAVPGQLSDHPGFRHPPRAQPAEGVRDPHLPGRGRDRRHRRRAGRRPSGCARRHGDQRTGTRLEVRGHRPGHQPRAPPGGGGRPRGGPSTGLPTKTEQADLLHAMYGRHGEAPLPILAPCTPSDCFATAIEAARIAVKYRTPVIVLSDGYLANGAEPGDCPSSASSHPSNRASPPRPTTPTTRATRSSGPTSATSRRWHVLGPRRACPAWNTESAVSRRPTAVGTVSYDGVNHERMVHLRRDKLAGIAATSRPSRSTTSPGRGAAPCELGLDLRRGRGGRQTGPRPGHESRPRPSAPPEPHAGQPR